MKKLKGSQRAIEKHEKWIEIWTCGNPIQYRTGSSSRFLNVKDDHVFKIDNQYRLHPKTIEKAVIQVSNNTIAEKRDRVVEMLEEAIDTRVERNAAYGEHHYGGAYIQHGYVMKALLPQGISAHHPDNMNRLMNLNVIVGKLVRYCANFETGGHDDSMKDIAVYSQIQRELDELFLANGAEGK